MSAATDTQTSGPAVAPHLSETVLRGEAILDRARDVAHLITERVCDLTLRFAGRYPAPPAAPRAPDCAACAATRERARRLTVETEHARRRAGESIDDLRRGIERALDLIRRSREQLAGPGG